MPSYYREKIRTLPGVAVVASAELVRRQYIKTTSRSNFFAQFGTDPDEFFKVYKDWKIPDDQVIAWQRDRAGAVVDSKKAEEIWLEGRDRRSSSTGTIFPTNLELTIRGIFTAPRPTQSLYYNQKYVEEAVALHEGAGRDFYTILANSPEDVPKIGPAMTRCSAIHRSPRRPKPRRHFSLASWPCWAT